MPDVRLCVCVILSAFSRCPLPPFGDPPASLITRYLGNSGLPRVCASVSVCGRVSECKLWLILLSSEWLSSHSCLGNTHPPTSVASLSVSLPPSCPPSLVSLHHPLFSNSFLSRCAHLVRLIMAVWSSNADLLHSSPSAVCSEQVRNTLIRTSSHEHHD